MNHALAKQIDDIAEAQALRVDDAIRTNENVMASVQASAADFANLVVGILKDQNKALTTLATATRDGTALLPPAPQLELVTVNADAVLDEEKAA